MAGPFDFVSPGAAFADALTQELAQRKADQRQQLIDSIAVRAEQRAQTEADSMNAYRNQEMGIAQQNADLAQLNAAFSHLRGGADLSHMDPAMLARARKYNMVVDTPIPQTSAGVSSFQQPDGTQTQATDAGATPPTPQFRPTYVGDLQYQAIAEQQKSDAQVVQSLLSDPDPAKQKLGQAAMKNLQMNNGMFSQDFKALLGPGVPVATWNPQAGLLNGKRLGADTTLAPNTQVLTQQPVVDNPVVVGVDQTTGAPIVIGSHSHKQIPLPEGTVSTKMSAADRLSSQWRLFHNDTERINFQSDQTQLNDPANVDPQVLTDYRLNAHNQINNSALPGPVKSIVNMWIANPAATEQLVKSGGIKWPVGYNQKLVERDLGIVRDVTNTLRPTGGGEILSKNPEAHTTYFPQHQAAKPTTKGTSLEDVLMGRSTRVQ